jgi:hypothetical protein
MALPKMPVALFYRYQQNTRMLANTRTDNQLMMKRVACAWRPAGSLLPF